MCSGIRMGRMVPVVSVLLCMTVISWPFLLFGATRTCTSPGSLSFSVIQSSSLEISFGPLRSSELDGEEHF